MYQNEPLYKSRTRVRYYEYSLVYGRVHVEALVASSLSLSLSFPHQNPNPNPMNTVPPISHRTRDFSWKQRHLTIKFDCQTSSSASSFRTPQTKTLRFRPPHPTPYAPTPCTLHPTLYTQLTPHTLHPTYTPHPTLYTPHPTSYTLHPAPYTLHPTPYTLHPTPYTLHPTP